jgi:hypothetical protein
MSLFTINKQLNWNKTLNINLTLIVFKTFRGIGEPKYMPVIEWASLNKILTDALSSYNELNAAMDLVRSRTSGPKAYCPNNCLQERRRNKRDPPLCPTIKNCWKLFETVLSSIQCDLAKEKQLCHKMLV